MKENEEIKKIICEACGREANDFVPCSEICPVCIRISKALIDLGYRKMKVKTNGDYIRMYGKSDEDLASEEIAIYTYGGKYEYSAKLVHTVFDTYEKAHKANLEYLKQEYKEK